MASDSPEMFLNHTKKLSHIKRPRHNAQTKQCDTFPVQSQMRQTNRLQHLRQAAGRSMQCMPELEYKDYTTQGSGQPTHVVQRPGLPLFTPGA